MAVHSIDAEDDQFAYRYDTQLLIDRRDEDLDEDEIAEYITEHFEGNSLIAAGDEDLIKYPFPHQRALEDSGSTCKHYSAVYLLTISLWRI